MFLQDNLNMLRWSIKIYENRISNVFRKETSCSDFSKSSKKFIKYVYMNSIKTL